MTAVIALTIKVVLKFIGRNAWQGKPWGDLRKQTWKVHCVGGVGKSDGEECSDDDNDDDDSDSSDEEQQSWLAELNWRRKHPERLHEELWFNLPQEVWLQRAVSTVSASFSHWLGIRWPYTFLYNDFWSPPLAAGFSALLAFSCSTGPRL